MGFKAHDFSQSSGGKPVSPLPIPGRLDTVGFQKKNSGLSDKMVRYFHFELITTWLRHRMPGVRLKVKGLEPQVVRLVPCAHMQNSESKGSAINYQIPKNFFLNTI